MSDEPDPARGARVNRAAMPLLHHVVYCSLAARDMDRPALGRLVASAQRNNLARNITGMLAFANGVFFQWIEGPRSQIERLMASLHRDTRHHHIVTLSETEEERERLYPDWDMEPVEADYLRKVLQHSLDDTDDANNTAALNRIVAQLDAGSFESLGRR